MSYVKLKNFDWPLFFVILLLTVLGLVAIYSLDLGKTDNQFLNFKKQAIFVGLGLACFFVFTLLNWRTIRGLSRFLYFLGAILLWAVLIFGQTRRASTGWFALGGFTLQPVEFAKFFFIAGGAAFFSRLGLVANYKDLAKSLFFLLLYLVPVILQPDLGGALMILFIWLGMFLCLKKPRGLLLGFVGLGIVAVIFSWFFFLQGYQQDRLLVFLNPGHDPLGRGYNVAQALVAIGSGGWLGQGLGGGTQSQLRFLPEAQTDFIFAVLAEELGFVAIFLVVAAQAFLLWRLLMVAQRVTDNYPLFFIVGAMVLFGAEATANIGMNLGLLPVAGLTLPLVSLGGSSLLAKLWVLGAVQSIRLRSY